MPARGVCVRARTTPHLSSREQMGLLVLMKATRASPRRIYLKLTLQRANLFHCLLSDQVFLSQKIRRSINSAFKILRKEFVCSHNTTTSRRRAGNRITQEAVLSRCRGHSIMSQYPYCLSLTWILQRQMAKMLDKRRSSNKNNSIH